LPSNTRPPTSGSRRLVIGLLIVVGGFLVFYGLGLDDKLTMALGLVVAVGGPVLLVVLNSRNRVRQFVNGQATVADVSPRPTMEGRSARGRLKLTIRAPGINGVTVTIHDSAIPLDKWPEPGATLPVRVLKGNPRKLTVQWDKVQTYQELMESDGGRPTGGGPDGAERYSVDGDDYGDEYGGPIPLHVPADNSQTLTNLPPITAPIAEPVRHPGRPATPSRHAVSPSHHPADSIGARTSTATVLTVPPPAGSGVDGDGRAATSGAIGPGGLADPGEPAGGRSEATGGHGAAVAFAAAAGAEFTTDESRSRPIDARVSAGVEDTADAATDRPATTEAITDTTSDTITDTTAEQAAVRLPTKPASGGSHHRRPSPRPRPSAHDRGRRPRADPAPDGLSLLGSVAPPDEYTVPEGGSLLAAPTGMPERPALTETPPGTAEPATDHNDPDDAWPVAGRASTSTEADPGDAWPAARSAAAPAAVVPADADPDDAWPAAVARDAPATPDEDVPADATDPIDAWPAATARGAAGTAVGDPDDEVEWWAEPEAASPPTAVMSYPDRETEQPPTRVPRLDESTFLDSDADTDTGAGGDADAGTWERPEAGRIPAPVDEPTQGRAGSAWSANGRGPVPVGAWLSSAPPIWPKPGRGEPAGDPDRDADEDEAVTPDPYATEHYLPEDQLEEQPLVDGGVAQFLPTASRQQATPLDRVNGVSITLIVSDLQRSRRFYRDMLGLKELDSDPEGAVLATGDARVVLRREADMPPVDRRVVHLNLEVPDVYEAYERLREQGVDFVHRPRVIPQGEQLELCKATFRDPDGHAIALTRWELRR